MSCSGIPDCNHLIESGKKRGLMIMAVVPKPSDGSQLLEMYPTAAAVSFFVLEVCTNLN